MAMAQTSFVVADKNGNSQLVQSLVFLQQQTADRFSWKSDGSANGDINDLLFIARAKSELATANTEDVTKMLEQLSGTDLADAEGIAATLQNNPQVEDAISEDGDNVVVKMKDSNSHIVYPLYEDADIISEYDFASLDAKVASAPKRARHQGNNYNGTIAIFNHFNGISGYGLQNSIVNNIKLMFEINGYDVAYYGTNQNNEYAGNIDYEQYFSRENLRDVIKNSSDYDAILIFSHGYKWDGKSYFATGEKMKYSSDEPELYCYEKEDGEYYFSYPVELLKTNNSCILYLGSCFGVPTNGYTANSFIYEKNSCFIGWNGKNRISQADAMVLFNYMLNENLTLDQAISCTFNIDPWNAGIQRYEYNTANHSLSASSKPNYIEDKTLAITSCEQFYSKADRKDYWEIRIKARGNWNFPTPVRIKIEPLLNDKSDLPYEHFLGFLFSGDEQVTHVIINSGIPEGLYKIYALTLENGEWKRLKTSPPRTILYSSNLSDNYSAPVPPESEIKRPVLLDSNGQQQVEITLPAGSSQTFSLDAYPGHTFETPCLDKSVCTVSLSGTTLTMTGVSEGSTYIGVYDVQNRQMTAVKVTVTAGCGDIVAYTSCPDAHHPHLIDLGLPSGTKWACCNVGADKPEDYGGYFAWGETAEKDYYYWDTYIHCDGSSSTCHDIGKDIAGTQYDAATANWGSPWEMPNDVQMEELNKRCTSEWTTENGVNGRRFTGPNGGSIFLPVRGSFGNYWSSTLSKFKTYEAYYLSIEKLSPRVPCYSRSQGYSVRPVLSDSIYTSCPDSHHPHMIDLGLPSGTKWACCNVGASNPEDDGGIYAWGEVEEKDVYNQRNYKYLEIDIGSNIGGTKYDVAHVLWGEQWCMPSYKQLEELCNNIDVEVITIKGVTGCRLLGHNGKMIFMPLASTTSSGVYGIYMSCESEEGNLAYPWYLRVSKYGNIEIKTDSWCYKWFGNYVRAVASGN